MIYQVTTKENETFKVTREEYTEILNGNATRYATPDGHSYTVLVDIQQIMEIHDDGDTYIIYDLGNRDADVEADRLEIQVHIDLLMECLKRIKHEDHNEHHPDMMRSIIARYQNDLDQIIDPRYVRTLV